MELQLQGYNFRIVYTKGNKNPSDFLCHHTNFTEPKREEVKEVMAEDYINFLSLHAVPRAMTLKEQWEATKADKTLQQLSK